MRPEALAAPRTQGIVDTPGLAANSLLRCLMGMVRPDAAYFRTNIDLDLACRQPYLVMHQYRPGVRRMVESPYSSLDFQDSYLAPTLERLRFGLWRRRLLASPHLALDRAFSSCTTKDQLQAQLATGIPRQLPRLWHRHWCFYFASYRLREHCQTLPGYLSVNCQWLPGHLSVNCQWLPRDLCSYCWWIDQG
jgi:hypothetical protein